MKQATGNYGIIVKTSEYAGNFEREMTAYCTGIVGSEDNTGEDFIEEDEIIVNFDNVEEIPDKNGTYRPVSLDPKDANNFIIWFDSKPTEEQRVFIENRAKSFSEYRKNHKSWGQFYQKDKPIKILGTEIKKF